MLILGSTGDTRTSSVSTSSPKGNTLQKKSIFVGQRPGLGVSSMLNQFKSYSQSKKNPVLTQRPSVFCSPDGEDEEEEADYSKFLEMKGNSRRFLVYLGTTPWLGRFSASSVTPVALAL